MITMRRELKAQRELLEYRKNRRGGIRLHSTGRLVYYTQESLESVRKAKEETTIKNIGKRRKKKATPIIIDKDEKDIQTDESSDSGSSCIAVARVEVISKPP